MNLIATSQALIFLRNSLILKDANKYGDCKGVRVNPFLIIRTVGIFFRIMVSFHIYKRLFKIERKLLQSNSGRNFRSSGACLEKRILGIMFFRELNEVSADVSFFGSYVGRIFHATNKNKLIKK